MKKWNLVLVVLVMGMIIARPLKARTLYVAVEPPAPAPPAGTRPVYRFWSPVSRSHFYTMSETEKDKLIEKYADLWIFEGPAFYAWPVPPEPNEALWRAPAGKGVSLWTDGIV